MAGWLPGEHWTVALVSAWKRLLGDERDSPITQERDEYLVSGYLLYDW